MHFLRCDLSNIGFPFNMTKVFFTVGPISDCYALQMALAILVVLTLNINNLLFLHRVRAVYGNSRIVSAFFRFCYVIDCVMLSFVIPTLRGEVSTLLPSESFEKRPS